MIHLRSFRKLFLSVTKSTEGQSITSFFVFATISTARKSGSKGEEGTRWPLLSTKLIPLSRSTVNGRVRSCHILGEPALHLSEYLLTPYHTSLTWHNNRRFIPFHPTVRTNVGEIGNLYILLRNVLCGFVQCLQSGTIFDSIEEFPLFWLL